MYKYQVRWVRVPQVDGSTQRKQIKGKTKKELDQKEKAILDKAMADIEKATHPMFCDVADDWYYSIEGTVAHYTYDGYKRPYLDLKEEFEGKRIDEVSAADIQALLDRKKAQGYAKQTINLRRIVANLIFRYAIIKGYITISPSLSTRVPRGAKKSHYPLPPNTDIEIIKNSLDEPLGLYFFFILYTGLRREEALALDWKDVDFDNRKIHINKVLIFINGKGVIEERAKSDSGIRSVPLLDPLYNILITLKNKKGLIFNVKGQPYYESAWIKHTNEYRRNTQIQSTSHSIRVAYATILHDAGMSDQDAKALMGHSKVELTKNIYMRISQSREQTNFDKLNNFVTSEG